MTHKRGAVSQAKVAQALTTSKKKYEVPKALYLDTKVEVRKALIPKACRGAKNERNRLTSGQGKAKAKAISQGIALRMVNVSSQRNHKAYFRMLGCSQVLNPKGSKMQTRYCNNRFCPVCGRIRTAKAIHDYLDPLRNLGQPLWFITLTRPAVKADDLRSSISGMIFDFKRIVDKHRKQGRTISGIRKVEANYNPKADTYNPHFHCLVSGGAEAELLLTEWLEKYPEADSRAQNAILADDDTYRELFKYLTKTYTTDERGDAFIYPEAMDALYTSLERKRTLQPFGVIRAKREVMPEAGQIVEESFSEYTGEIKQDAKTRLPDLIYLWSQGHYDWVNFDHLIKLTGYIPSDKDKRIIDGLKKHRGNIRG